MGISTDAQICYGIAFEEGFEFPWHHDRYDYFIDDWWVYEICGYENPFELYDGYGEHLDGVTAEMVDEYYDSLFEFKKSNPIPIEEVTHCSDEYPMYILAVPETVIIARRGYPESLDLSKLIVSEQQKHVLIDFCINYDIEIPDEPKWWLCSYWG